MMMQEQAHQMGDRATAAARWLVWRPLRLVGVIVAVVLVWIVIVQVTSPPKGPAGPTSTATPTSGLPSGWESWPSTTGR